MIQIRDFSFRYREASEAAVHDVNLSIAPGTFVGITGAAGCGKSTLTYALNGIVPHCYPGDFYGSVSVNGADTVDTPLTDISRLVGSVCQDIDSQMVSPVVEDEVLFGMENFGMAREDVGRRLEEVLDEVGIGELRHRSIASLSGGQKQKVAIAAVLAARPPVLVLDEPTAELDPASSVAIFDLLARYARKHGTTVVVVEQKIALLSRYADKLVVLEGGRVRFDAPPREVLEHAEELFDLGVNVPRVTSLSRRLKAAHLHEGPLCRTVEEACAMAEALLAQGEEVPRAGEGTTARGTEAPDGREGSQPLPGARNLPDSAAPACTVSEEAPSAHAVLGEAPCPATQLENADCAQPQHAAAALSPQTDAPFAVEFRDVCAGYADSSPVLRDVSLSVAAGEFVAFTGTNGAGKSTAMRLVNGLLRPTSGTVAINGENAARLKTSDLARTVGFLFQNPDRQICCNTVREELLFGFAAQNRLDSTAEAQVDAAIEEFSFDPAADPFLLNRGSRQLLALASVLVLQPRIVVLDEPTTGLDFRECEKVMRAVQRLHAGGTTVIIVCHDMEVVADYAQRVVVMHEGQVVDSGPTFDVLRHSESLARASMEPPQMMALALHLGRKTPETPRSAAREQAAAANTLDEMTDALLHVKGV